MQTATPPDLEQRAVFLSHAHADREDYVWPFSRELDRHRVTYWLDLNDMVWGDTIGDRIEEGLKRSRFVVVFLSENYIGREWTELELSAALTREDSEGRRVVLPVIIGDQEQLLSNRPLLRDKTFLHWEIGVERVVAEFQNLLFMSQPRPHISVPLQGTSHSIPVRPDVLLELLYNMTYYDHYGSHSICATLRRSGLLADVYDEDAGIEVNGVRIRVHGPGDKGWGPPGHWQMGLVPEDAAMTERGIWAYDIAKTCSCF